MPPFRVGSVFSVVKFQIMFKRLLRNKGHKTAFVKVLAWPT